MSIPLSAGLLQKVAEMMFIKKEKEKFTPFLFLDNYSVYKFPIKPRKPRLGYLGFICVQVSSVKVGISLKKIIGLIPT